MTKITVENYESFFLDYMEGRLDASMIRELESFLITNPHLKKELELANSIYLEAEHYAFEGKQELRKFEFETQPITGRTFNDFCIASYENILTESKREELTNYIQTKPDAFNNYLAFGKTYLIPENITFPNRNMLYHKTPVKIISLHSPYTWLSIAATIAILAGAYFGFNKTTPVKQVEISTVAKIETPVFSKSAEKVDYLTDKNTTAIKTKPIRNNITEELPDSTTFDRKTEPEPEFLQPIGTKLLVNVQYSQEENLSNYFNAGRNRQTIPIAENDEEIIGKRKLLVFVENSLSKINRVTNTSLALNHETNSTGQIKSFTIKAAFIRYEWKSNKK